MYNMLHVLHVLIFQSNDDSVINQGRIIHTGTVHWADYNESVYCLFIFYGKNRNYNVVPKFFKMFSIVQMMFIKDVILIQ